LFKWNLQFFSIYSCNLPRELYKTLNKVLIKFFQSSTFRVIRLESYSTAGISITQGVPCRDCPIGFTSRVCVCVRVRVRVRVRVCACARARARLCQPVARSVDSSGRTKFSFIQVFQSNVQNIHHYSVNIIEVYFQSFLILISVFLELSLHKLFLFYLSSNLISSNLIIDYCHKRYFSNNSRRKNPHLNLVILEATGLVLLDLSNDGLSA